MDTKLFGSLIALTLGGCLAHGGAGPLLDEGERIGFAEELGALFDCRPGSQDPLRAYCVAGKTTLLPFSFPDDESHLLGITGFVRTDRPIQRSLFEAGSLQLGVLSRRGADIDLVQAFDGRDPEWQRDEALVHAVVATLGGRTQVPLPEGPLSLDAVVEVPLAPPLCVDPAGADLAGRRASAVRMSLVRNPFGGEAYVVLERETHGVRLSIFPRNRPAARSQGVALAPEGVNESPDRARLPRRVQLRGATAAGYPLRYPAVGATTQVGPDRRPGDGRGFVHTLPARAPNPPDDRELEAIRLRFATAIDCGPAAPESPFTLLCPLTQLTSAPVPRSLSPHALLGVTFLLVEGGELGAAVRPEALTVGWLALRPTDFAAGWLLPESPAERVESEVMVRRLSARLAYPSKLPFEVPADLHALVQGQLRQAQGVGAESRLALVANPRGGIAYLLFTRVKAGLLVGLYPVVPEPSAFPLASFSALAPPFSR